MISFIASSAFNPFLSASKFNIILCLKIGYAIFIMSSILTWFLPINKARAFEASIIPIEALGEAPYCNIFLLSLVVVTIFTAWVFVGSIDMALKIGILDTVVKIAAFYFHERFWNRVEFGKSKPPEYQI